MVCAPKHVPLVSFQSSFSCIVFVQATTSLMMASVCLRACATRTHWLCFLFDEWHCPCVGSTACALCFSSTAFLMTINDGNTTPTTLFPFHSSLSLPNHTALAKHGASSNSSSHWLLVSVCQEKHSNGFVSAFHHPAIVLEWWLGDEKHKHNALHSQRDGWLR